MNTAKIDDHVAEAIARLLQQYKGRSNVEGLFTAIVQMIQKLENAMYPLIQYRQLAFAYGSQLDGLGLIIGQRRNGLSDDQYRVLLIGTIAANYSDTTSTAILNIIQTVFQAQNVFLRTPNSTGGGAVLQAHFGFSVGSPALPASLYTLAEQVVFNSAGAGIGVSYISKHAATGCFAMAGNQAWTKSGPPTFTPDVDHPWPFGCGGYSYDTPNPYIGGGFCELVYKDAAE